jgi:hypothetical protein
MSSESSSHIQTILLREYRVHFSQAWSLINKPELVERFRRLISIFLRVSIISLQNHLFNIGYGKYCDCDPKLALEQRESGIPLTENGDIRKTTGACHCLVPTQADLRPRMRNVTNLLYPCQDKAIFPGAVWLGTFILQRLNPNVKLA